MADDRRDRRQPARMRGAMRQRVVRDLVVAIRKGEVGGVGRVRHGIRERWLAAEAARRLLYFSMRRAAGRCRADHHRRWVAATLLASGRSPSPRRTHRLLQPSAPSSATDASGNTLPIGCRAREAGPLSHRRRRRSGPRARRCEGSGRRRSDRVRHARRHLMAAIERIAKTSDPSVRAVVVTAAGPQQAGDCPRLHRRRRSRRRPAAGARRARPPTERRPAASTSRSFISYDNDYQIRLGEVEVEVEHVGSGRTGADSVVVFRGLRVVAVGELFTTDAPQPDCASGGSFAGWAAAIDHLAVVRFRHRRAESRRGGRQERAHGLQGEGSKRWRGERRSSPSAPRTAVRPVESSRCRARPRLQLLAGDRLDVARHHRRLARRRRHSPRGHERRAAAARAAEPADQRATEDADRGLQDTGRIVHRRSRGRPATPARPARAPSAAVGRGD